MQEDAEPTTMAGHVGQIERADGSASRHATPRRNTR